MNSTSPRLRADVHAHLAGDEHGQRGLAESGRPEEQDVIERLAPLPRRVDGDLEVLLHAFLAHEFVQPGRPQRGLGGGLVGQRLGRGDLGAAHRFAAASQRTGRSPGVTTCLA
jgi:hypothetical protein